MLRFEGPITNGRPSLPIDPRAVRLDRAGYVQEEWFVSGTATAFAPVDPTDPAVLDGQWDTTPEAEAHFATRLVVRRPANRADASGHVVVEWLNVSAVEVAPEWAYLEPAITDAAMTWIGVSAQASAIVGGSELLDTGTRMQEKRRGGIVAANPERYGALHHPGDRFAFDIFGQIGSAFRSGAGKDVVGPDVGVVLAAGQSQSAAFLTTFVNAVQPIRHAYDGFFIHGRGSGAARLDGSPSVRWSGGGVLLRDCEVPVLVLESETDVGPVMGFAHARQPDTPTLRIWEVAGTAHADAHLVGRNFALCPHPVNAGPLNFVACAAFEHLIRWAGDHDSPPPTAPPIEIVPGNDVALIHRDLDGIALGGLRTPSVDVPSEVLSGTSPPESGDDRMVSLFGSTTPYPRGALKSRYGSRDAYLAAFESSLDDAIAAGYVRAADRDAYAAQARVVDFVE